MDGRREGRGDRPGGLRCGGACAAGTHRPAANPRACCARRPAARGSHPERTWEDRCGEHRANQAPAGVGSRAGGAGGRGVCNARRGGGKRSCGVVSRSGCGAAGWPAPACLPQRYFRFSNPGSALADADEKCCRVTLPHKQVVAAGLTVAGGVFYLLTRKGHRSVLPRGRHAPRVRRRVRRPLDQGIASRVAGQRLPRQSESWRSLVRAGRGPAVQAGAFWLPFLRGRRADAARFCCVAACPGLGLVHPPASACLPICLACAPSLQGVHGVRAGDDGKLVVWVRCIRSRCREFCLLCARAPPRVACERARMWWFGWEA